MTQKQTLNGNTYAVLSAAKLGEVDEVVVVEVSTLAACLVEDAAKLVGGHGAAIDTDKWRISLGEDNRKLWR
jgi:hypothetical protein